MVRVSQIKFDVLCARNRVVSLRLIVYRILRSEKHTTGLYSLSESVHRHTYLRGSFPSILHTFQVSSKESIKVVHRRIMVVLIPLLVRMDSQPLVFSGCLSKCANGSCQMERGGVRPKDVCWNFDFRKVYPFGSPIFVVKLVFVRHPRYIFLSTTT
jgi:hypothetical protein